MALSLSRQTTKLIPATLYFSSCVIAITWTMALPKTTRRWILPSLDGPTSLKLETVDLVPPAPNQVVVKMAAWSLNYRDLALSQGMSPVPLPLLYVPLSDGAGVVTAIGEQVKSLVPGNKVFSVFKPMWRSGRLRREFEASASPNVPGILSDEYIDRGWCHAWNALYGLPDYQLRPGQYVLTEGTGGVSIFSLQFAKAGGAKVIATTSSTRKAEVLLELGADHVINYNEVTAWAEAVKSLTPGNKGVDLVVDVVGGNTMTQALKTVKSDGLVTIVGFIAGVAEQQPSTVDIYFNMATFRAIHCGSLEHVLQMKAAIEQHNIKPYVDCIFRFEDVPAAYKHLSKQNFMGTSCPT